MRHVIKLTEDFSIVRYGKGHFTFSLHCNKHSQMAVDCNKMCKVPEETLLKYLFVCPFKQEMVDYFRSRNKQNDQTE